MILIIILIIFKENNKFFAYFLYARIILVKNMHTLAITNSKQIIL